MAVRKSVFGSKGEERGFRSIEHTWDEEYRVFPQLPFSWLFEPDPGWRDTANLFFKTSIDYVLCTKAGRPLLAIDFDGLGRGFDRDGQYIQVEETRDPHRKLKFDFKLRYAKKNDFPYYVVASEEFRRLDKEIELTAMDGIIGAVLAGIDFEEHIESLVEENREAIDNLPPDEQYEYTQDLVLQQEVMSDLDHNLVTQRVLEFREQIQAISGSWSWREEHRHYEEPELPNLEGRGVLGSLKGATARLAAMSEVERVGCVFTLSDTPVGEVSDIVWIRNVGSYSQSLTLVRKFAELLACNKLLRLLRKRAE